MDPLGDSGYSSLLRSCKFSKTKTVTEHVQYFKNCVCACSVAVFISAEFARSQQTAVPVKINRSHAK